MPIGAAGFFSHVSDAKLDPVRNETRYIFQSLSKQRKLLYLSPTEIFFFLFNANIKAEYCRLLVHVTAYTLMTGNIDI
jgi:hypothetical protein